MVMKILIIGLTISAVCAFVFGCQVSDGTCIQKQDANPAPYEPHHVMDRQEIQAYVVLPSSGCTPDSCGKLAIDK